MPWTHDEIAAKVAQDQGLRIVSMMPEKSVPA
jgi:hypothetical protein